MLKIDYKMYVDSTLVLVFFAAGTCLFFQITTCNKQIHIIIYNLFVRFIQQHYTKMSQIRAVDINVMKVLVSYKC
jgi:hypothetical protein